MARSHSTRVRGLKYCIHRDRIPIDAVALYTSAWIEIQKAVHKAGMPQRRTLHECVDWNDGIHKQASLKSQSHSTRVRGLKWIEGYSEQTLQGVALYTSAWIEIDRLSKTMLS